jgi:hypothetical protein
VPAACSCLLRFSAAFSRHSMLLACSNHQEHTKHTA